MRTLLSEAANVMLTRYKGQLKLKDWAFAIARPSTMRKALIAAVLRRGRVRHQAEAAPDRPRIIALNAPELNQSITLSQTSGRKPRSDPEAQIVRHRKASGLKHPRS